MPQTRKRQTRACSDGVDTEGGSRRTRRRYDNSLEMVVLSSDSDCEDDEELSQNSGMTLTSEPPEPPNDALPPLDVKESSENTHDQDVEIQDNDKTASECTEENPSTLVTGISSEESTHNNKGNTDDAGILDNDETVSVCGEILEIDDVDDTVSVGEEILDKDELVSKFAENASTLVTRITRKELKELVLQYSVEAICNHSDVGDLRMKVEKLETTTEEMKHVMSNLQNQVQEMDRKLKTLTEAHSYNQDHNGQKIRAVKYCRNVGVQIKLSSNTLKTSCTNRGKKNISAGEEYTRSVPIVKGLTQNSSMDTEAAKRANKNVGFIDDTNASDRQISEGSNRSKKTETATGVKFPTRNPNSSSKPTGEESSSAEAYSGTSQGSISSSPLVNEAQTALVLLAQNATTENSQEKNYIKPLTSLLVERVTTLKSSSSFTVTTGQQSSSIEASSGTSQVPISSSSVVNNVPPKSTPKINCVEAQVQPSQTITSFASELAKSSRSSSRVAFASSTYTGKTPPLPPATLSVVPNGVELKDRLPRPSLIVTKVDDLGGGVELIWNTPTPQYSEEPEEANLYQIFACKESITGIASAPVKMSEWKQVAKITPLPLPMSCKLTVLPSGNRYYFIIRALDCHGRSGPFSDIVPIYI